MAKNDIKNRKTRKVYKKCVAKHTMSDTEQYTLSTQYN